MVLRIEYILMVIFTVLIVSIFGFNPASKEAISSTGDREVEFKNFSVYNVKEDNTGQQMHALKATKYKKYMDFNEVDLIDEQGNSIHSDKAKFENDLLYMNDNVKVSRDDGVKFFTDNLTYSLKEKEILAKEKFLLEYNKSTIRGENLEVNIDGKELSGYQIDASIWFSSEKQ